ncbi:MAG: hypothetical protein IIA45_10750 [Bacteroidetes bacterium]|nr:hypothetical protein [Bacteroidota bacterium]
MRAIALLIIFALSTGLLYSQTDLTGFRGIEWGTPFEEISEKLTPSKNKTPGVKGYDMKDNDYNFEGVVAHTMTYGFKKDKFHGVNIGVYNKDLETVVASLTEKYGEPKVTKTPILDNYEWHLPSTSITLTYFMMTKSEEGVTIGFSKSRK